VSSNPEGFRVAVPVPLRQALDYLAPTGNNPVLLQAGMRVRVPVGRRHLVGVVMARGLSGEVSGHRLRRIEAILDAAPLLDEVTLDLIRFTASYYHHPLGEVVATALPKLLRAGGPARLSIMEHWRIRSDISLDDAVLARAPRQRALLDFMRSLETGGQPVSSETLAGFGPSWRTLAHALAARGWIERIEKSPCTLASGGESPPPLNSEQLAAVGGIWPASTCSGFGVHLLDGVTGSGKTEVYMGLIAKALEDGRQVLVLVPEIGLTPQLLKRFQRRFSVPIASLHSGLSETARRDAWLASQSGEAAILIGTRSAVFTPMPRLGLIVVDEEHDASFKQQDGLRYHARDLAVWRARRQQVPIVLGSATPSLETLRHALEGHYRHHRLTRRAGNARPPRLRVLDIRHNRLEAGLSAQLMSAVRERVEQGEQVLLFLNRRGYAPVLICHECGWTASCPRCDAHLTWHAASYRLRCHHCGHETTVPASCPECGAEKPRPLGEGTERVEQQLSTAFPGEGILRIDRDTTRWRGALDASLEAAHGKSFPILLGTQMLTKGHHFPRVTLVGVLDADQGLYNVDYRAHEQLAQLLVQVAGRAGRAERPGEVIIQTHQPEHPLLQTLLRGGYEAAAVMLLEERRISGMPPYANLALVRAEAVRPEAAMRFLEAAREVFSAEQREGADVLGPVPAPMERRAGRYRFQLLLRATERAILHRWLARALPVLDALPESRRTRWSLDVDPIDLY